MTRPRSSRVLMVVDALHGGGAERHVLDLAVGLRDRGWLVDVACSSTGRKRRPFQDAGVPVHELVGQLVKRRVSARYAAALRTFVGRGAYDVVHAHIYASEVAAALATIRSPSQLVLTEHTEAPWRGRAARLTSRWVYGRAAMIIAVSQAIRSRLVSDYAVPECRIRCLLPVGRPGVLPAPKQGAALEPAGHSLVGFVGRLEESKGVDVLLRALPAVLRVRPDVRLVVVGTGPEEGRLRCLAEQLGIDAAVRFLGFRDDARALLTRFDLLVVPSRTDGSPLVVHEALEAGVPVIGSAVGGIVDRLAGGAAGVLVPAADVDRLSAEIVALLADPARRAHLAGAGRGLTAEVTYPAMMDAVERVYDDVLGVRATAGS